MAYFRRSIVVVILAILLLAEIQICLSAEISRADFPHGFVFGTASSAFQVSSIPRTVLDSILFWFAFSFGFRKITVNQCDSDIPIVTMTKTIII
jgi:beta-glucosidase